MLPKSNRLLTEKEISNVFRTKSRAYSDCFAVFLKPNYSQNFRLLVSVSKKIHKKAFYRNKVKRKIVSIFDSKIYQSSKLKGLDCIVQAKKLDIQKLKHFDLKEQLLSNLKYLVLKNHTNKFVRRA